MTSLDALELPSLPGSRRWENRPEKIGDIGLDDSGDAWLWLESGLLWIEKTNFDIEWPEELDGEDFLDSIRYIARST